MEEKGVKIEHKTGERGHCKLYVPTLNREKAGGEVVNEKISSFK